MKKTIYKGMRLGGILLCLTLIVACIVPTVALADTADVAEQDSVHFINPTAITVVGDSLYVADIIENGKTALLRFDINNDKPTLKYTYELNGEISKLSNDGQNSLYAICGNKVTELSLSESLPQIVKTFDFENEVVGFVKGTFGQNKVEFALTNRLLRYNNVSNSFAYATENTLSETKGCVALGDIVFYIYKNGSNFVAGGFNGNIESMSFLTNFVTVTTEPIGITAYQNKVAFYSQHSIMYVNDITMGYWTNNQPMQGNALENLITDTGDKTIVDVAIHGETIFILNDGINTIDMYVKGESDYGVTYTIGSDMVDKTVPTSYTSFTLVQPKGYPANIVYKTNASTSVSDIITDAKEYTILGYENEQSSHYYYVLVGDKFGWVKKSDNATSPSNDSKLTIVNNNRGDATFKEEAKFVSPNAVYVYNLPLESAEKVTVTQTASTMKTVTLLQEYKEGDVTWYYVSYDDGKTGFVKKSDVGQIRFAAKSSPNIIGDKQINSSLFSSVHLYHTAELIDNDYVPDSSGKNIELYSGNPVKLIKVEGDSAFVMIVHSNGEQDFGWVDASRLIDRGQMTTNAIVGLSLLAVAIALATVLLIVYFKHKKKIKRNAD